MNDLKLTDWYTGDQKPMKVGPYQRRYSSLRGWSGSAPLYCWWDGKFFKLPMRKPDECKASDGNSDHQDIPWRGLAEDPNAGYVTVRIPRPVRVSLSDNNMFVLIDFALTKEQDEFISTIREAIK